MFRLWLYQEVVRRCMETFLTLKNMGREILSQIFVERKLGGLGLMVGAVLPVAEGFAVVDESPVDDESAVVDGRFAQASGARLTLTNSFAIKTPSRPAHSFLESM